MMDQSITIVVNGQTVQGRIRFLTLNDISVEIAYPFSGVSTRSHIAYFALPYMRFEKDGVITAYGEKRACELLREIYEACTIAEATKKWFRK